MNESGEKKVMKLLRESLETQDTLILTATQRGIPCDLEPFAGQQVGPLTVCGPALTFYEALLLDFTNIDKLAEFESAMEAREREERLEPMYEDAGLPVPEYGLLDTPQTDPEKAYGLLNLMP